MRPTRSLSPRLPAFHPVPVRARRDGWTPARQAEYIGRLAETGCVTAAARAVGMGRESAYRLRNRPGAEGFARAWDAALAPRPAKSTVDVLAHRAAHGLLRPLLHRGRYLATEEIPDRAAERALLRRLDDRRRGPRSKIRGKARDA